MRFAGVLLYNSGRRVNAVDGGQGMSITIELSPEKERMLAVEASRQGIQASEFMRDLLERWQPEPVRPDLSTEEGRQQQIALNAPTIALLEEWRREDEEWLAHATPEEIERERAELEAFQKALDDNRRSSGDYRTLFS